MDEKKLKKLKKLATSEQVENLNLRLTREILTTQEQIAFIKGAIIAMAACESKNSRKIAFMVWVSAILQVSIMLNIGYEIYKILNKLTALGL